MQKIKKDIVSALIISKDNKILLGRKFPHRDTPHPGCWYIPGGGVDAGESKIQALIRETKEEIGLDITGDSAELIDFPMEGEGIKIKDGVEYFQSMTFFIYKIQLDGNTDEISFTPEDQEFERLEWFRFDELKDLKLPPPSIKLFTHLGWL